MAQKTSGRTPRARRLELVMKPKKVRVLVVDDQPRVTRFLEVYLRLKGFDVFCADSGVAALEIARAREPDIVIVDIVMSGMDGLEVMRKLRTFSRVPVIAFSASPGNHRDAADAGADDFLPKPFHVEEMLVRINRLLGLQAS
jgi:two-component system KDP operon response regulator KdpE